MSKTGIDYTNEHLKVAELLERQILLEGVYSERVRQLFDQAAYSIRTLMEGNDATSPA